MKSLTTKTKLQNGPLLEVSHENDLLRNGISIPERAK